MKSIRMTPEQVKQFYAAHPCPECEGIRKERDEALASIKRMQDYFGDVTITAKKLEEAEAALSRYRDGTGLVQENAALRGEVARLREAVEWAADLMESTGEPFRYWSERADELRRRAGEGE